MTLRGVSLALFLGAAASAAPTASTTPTFSKDVLPILQRNCQGCHRPGEAAPMSFLNYREARPWAKAIKGAVLTKKMPPWLADPHYGQFMNARTLTDAEIQTIVSWADGGAPEGDPKNAPAPRRFTDGWQLGQPDLVLTPAGDFHLGAGGHSDRMHRALRQLAQQSSEPRPEEGGPVRRAELG